MKTDHIIISNKGAQMGKALQLAEKTAVFQDLSPKNALHLRLLTEEMMAMMRSITGEKEGEFWIESRDNLYELHLLVVTPMTSVKREDLLAASTTGKNAAARGLMGRVRDFFERGADEDLSEMVNPLILHEMYENSSTPALDWEWSMDRYEHILQERVDLDDGTAKEAWDELEKSVVARVADDVIVSIRGRQVEMTILKKMD